MIYRKYERCYQCGEIIPKGATYIVFEDKQIWCSKCVQNVIDCLQHK